MLKAHYSFEKSGVFNSKQIFYHLTIPELFEHALQKKEGILSSTGAFSVLTGAYTGRSPEDRFIVDDKNTHDLIDWGKVNKPISQEIFGRLYAKLVSYLQQKDVYINDTYIGTDPNNRLAVRFINEFAYASIFVNNMFLDPSAEELESFIPDFTVICCPQFKAIPEIDGVRSEAFVIINFKERKVIIGGTSYCGEIKKAIFTVMNYLLPQKGVLPMHCSANIGKNNDVAIFFGLSGTGKTSLSADIERRLIGDDEHGWSEQGIFNFEGGCYAKCINLSKEKEPQIWDAIRYGAIMENVYLLPETRQPDYTDHRYTENTRVSYPIEFIPNALIPGIAGHPKVVIFLTADAFGVMPPVAKLTTEKAIYNFILGYTSKLAGTERGIVEPQATFSVCFGAPFMPLNPKTYAQMLGKKITQCGSRVYLVNTGWIGGPYGVGKRIDIDYTRKMVKAAIDGTIDVNGYHEDPIFQFSIPNALPGIPNDILNPGNLWSNHSDYSNEATKLRNRFDEVMKKYLPL